MIVLLIASVLISTVTTPAHLSLGGPPNIRHGLSRRPVSPYDYSTIYSQPFDEDLLENGYSNLSAADRWVCDDFILEFDADIREIVVYQIYSGQQASNYNIAISVDDTVDSDPNTNTVIWAETVPCTNYFLYGPWGINPVYEVTCTIPYEQYPELEAGVHYYLEMQADVADNCFLLVSVNFIGDYCWYDDGSGIYVRSDIVFGEDSDMFFELYGEPLSLDPMTWAGIKSLY